MSVETPPPEPPSVDAIRSIVLTAPAVSAPAMTFRKSAAAIRTPSGSERPIRPSGTRRLPRRLDFGGHSARSTTLHVRIRTLESP